MPTETRVGDTIVEGKTKIVRQAAIPEMVIVESKDDLTAGDGAKHDVLPGKGSWATTTTCNVFRLLKACGIPVAFDEQLDATHFSAQWCRMVPLEVVVRREGHGSYGKRNPHLAKGQLFPRLVYELFLKTSGKKWDGHDLPCDDPMLFLSAGKAKLFVPSVPLWEQTPFLDFWSEQLIKQCGGERGLAQIREYALRIFLILEKAWQLLDERLVDFKLEFGLDCDGNIRLADVVDSDSWRKIRDGQYADKQVYRDGGKLSEVAEKYLKTAELTCQFKLPRQQIILWKGSEKDDIKPFLEELTRLDPHSKTAVRVITCSGHKDPVSAYNLLQAAVQNVPDSVLVVYVGRSNGAGPMLSACTTIPTITVPATVKEFPDDVWSSLRTPSTVPVMTVLDPKNAALAALQILAARSPALYANLRFEQEKRLVNNVVIYGNNE